jgi:hypothetical protein
MASRNRTRETSDKRQQGSHDGRRNPNNDPDGRIAAKQAYLRLPIPGAPKLKDVVKGRYVLSVRL